MHKKHVYLRVQRIYEDLTQKEQKIAQFVLDHPEQVIKMTTKTLAKASGTSPASVIRFCKSIGILSFPDLKLALSAERSSPKNETYCDVLPNENISDLKHKLLTNATQTLTETVQLADDTRILKAAKEIARAAFVYVYGIGASYLVAENFVQKWSRLGKVCICIADVHQCISTLTSAPKETLFIGISSSGETNEVLTLHQLAKDRGLKTISMTEFGVNRLSKKADINLYTMREKEVNLRSAATQSLMSQFMLIDLLFYTYVLADYDNHMKHILKSRACVDQYKRKS